MLLTPTDYFVLTAAAGGAVLGLFIGFSGAAAFLSGTLVASFCALFGWQALGAYVSMPWLRALATVVGALLAFGLTRMIVRRFVRVMFAQPADAIFGALAAGFSACACALGLVWLGNFLGLLPYPSALLGEVLSHVG